MYIREVRISLYALDYGILSQSHHGTKMNENGTIQQSMGARGSCFVTSWLCERKRIEHVHAEDARRTDSACRCRDKPTTGFDFWISGSAGFGSKDALHARLNKSHGMMHRPIVKRCVAPYARVKLNGSHGHYPMPKVRLSRSGRLRGVVDSYVPQLPRDHWRGAAQDHTCPSRRNSSQT